jgi:hypothetical protein
VVHVVELLGIVISVACFAVAYLAIWGLGRV